MAFNITKTQMEELLKACKSNETRRGSFAQCDARFAGAKDKGTVEAFISRVAIYKDMEHISDEEALRALPLLLTEKASLWWQGERNAINNWEEALKAIRNTFAPEKEPHQIYALVFAEKQGDAQPTEEFVVAKRALLAQLPERRHDEATVLDMIYSMLNLNIRSQLPRKEINGFESLLTKARRLEDMAQERKIPPEKAAWKTGKRCNICRRNGHTAEVCWKRTKFPKEEQVANTEVERKPEVVTANTPLTCYACGKAGHFRNKCPEKVNKEKPTTSSVNFYALHTVTTFAAEVPTIEVEINGITGVAHLDTAARTSVAGATLYKHLQKTASFTTQSVEVALADGSRQIQTIEQTTVDIVIQTRRFTIDMIVLPEAKENRTLLGIDFLEKAEIILNLAQRAYSFARAPEKNYFFLEKDPASRSQRSSPTPQAIAEETPEVPLSPFLTIFASPLPEEDCEELFGLQKLDTPPKAYTLFEGDPDYSPGAIQDIFRDAIPKQESPSKDPRFKRRKLELNSIEISSTSLSNEQRAELIALFGEFEDVLKEEGPPTPYAEHRIETGDQAPIACPPYRLSPAKSLVLKEKIGEMLDAGIIEEAETPWTFPVVLVPKKNGDHRVCVDFRRLNAVTTSDQYPLPRIDDLLHAARGLPYMSSLDLKAGYWQVAIVPEHRDKTGLITPFGLYRFTRMPFGLRNAPATFQRLMDRFKIGLPDVSILVYLDDVIVRSKSFSQHITDLRRVLEHLRKYRLRINKEKCNICCDSIKYLGHLITTEGISTDPEKVATVVARGPPQNVKQLLSFVISNFAQVAKPMTDLTRKNATWKWGASQEEAFMRLKELLTTAPVLKQADFEKPFVIKTDASQYAIGALLAQGEREEEHPIEFAGRLLSPAERNYSTTEKEALAIVYAVNKFRGYIEGAPAIVVTDHQPLTWLMTLKTPTGRLARWALQLQPYDIKVRYTPGRINHVPDCLSRPPLKEPIDSHDICHVQIDFPSRSQKEIRDKQLEDPDLKIIIQAMETDNDEANEKWYQRGYLLHHGILYRYTLEQDDDEARLVVPKKEQDAILIAYHDAPTAGHYGVEKTIDRIAKRYFWSGMRATVVRHVGQCVACQRYKIQNRKPAGLLQTSVVNRRFEVVAVDLFGPLPPAKNDQRWILIVEDVVTRWVELFAMEDATAENCATLLLEEVFLRYGMPRRMLSDNGSQFISAIMQKLTYCLGIGQALIPVYHAEANPVERRNRDLKTQLGILVGQQHNTWAEHLAGIRFAMNSAKCESTGATPAYLMFGRELRTPRDTYEDFSSIVISDNYVAEITPRLKNLAHALKLAREFTEKRQDRNQADSARRPSPRYEVGDLIWVSTHPISNAKKGVTSKFAPRRDGPYKILRKRGPTSYEVANVQDDEKVGVYHTSALTPYKAADETIPVPANPIRQRGRPRKAQPENEEPKVNEDTEIPSKRGRGRPRKVQTRKEAPDDDRPNNAKVPAKRERGRPRKPALEGGFPFREEELPSRGKGEEM